MRIIIFLLVSFLVAQTVLSQEPTQQPTKKELTIEIQKQIADLKKEIAEVEKQIGIAQKDDPESVKDLEQQLRMLKEQLATIEETYKGISGMSEKTFQEAATAEEENNSIPKRDITRISILPKKILSDAELASFVRTVNTEVEKMIPATEKAGALKIYNETKAKYNSTDVTGNAASGCWMYGHWEKALCIMGRACMDDMTNTDNLNNYAAFLSMTGAEQAALPILQWLNNKYPKNSTILNNIGQAWFGLGDMTNSKKYLDSATNLYNTHSMANATLSKIYESEGDSAKAISSLKKAIRENYDPEKEHELNRLGIQLTFDDLPELDYPMKTDPLGLIPLIELFPEDFPSAIGDDGKVDAVNKFVDGAQDLNEKLDRENEVLSQKVRGRNEKLSSDSLYRGEFLEPYNSPAWKLAQRSIELFYAEKSEGMASLATQFLFHFPIPFVGRRIIIDPQEILHDCDSIWENEVVIPLARLPYERPGAGENPTCDQVNAWVNAYQAKVAAIQNKGMKKIKKIYVDNSGKLDKWMKINIYALQDAPKDIDGKTSDLITSLDKTILRRRLENSAFQEFLDYGLRIVKEQEYLVNNCGRNEVRKKRGLPVKDVLTPLVKYELPCEFIKTLKTPLVGFTAKCNTIEKDPNSKIEERKPPVQKGQGQISKKGNQNRGPLNNMRRGPFAFYDYTETEIINQRSAPLNAEDKDPSQFSIEYDKWGNLVGLNVQLNEDGTALADPDSQESGIDSRWSWNAAGNTSNEFLPFKGKLNKTIFYQAKQ